MPREQKKRSRNHPALLFIVPSLAVLVSLLSVVLGGSEEPLLAAQLWGGPTDSSDGFRGRLLLLREASSVAAPVNGQRVVMRARQGNHEVERELVSGPYGWAEFSLPRFVNESLELEVLSGESILAQGTPELSTKRWRGAATRRGGRLPTHTEGSLQAHLSVESAVLGVPFSSKLKLSAKRGSVPARNLQFQLSGDSLQILGETKGELDALGTADFQVRPTHHVASLLVRLGKDGKALTFDQILPVVPGSLGMERTPEGILVRSPIPRESVWYTFVTEQLRLSGGRLPLQQTAQGHAALLPKSEIPKGQGRYLVLSSEADGRSPSTVGFPLDGQETSFEVWDGYLLDGLPQVRDRRARALRKFRITLGAYAALSGFVTLILFWLHVVRSERQLERDLRRVGADLSAQSRSRIPLVIAVICLFFAFSAAVLWIVAR